MPTSYTAFENEFINGTRRHAVVAKGHVELTVNSGSSPGWSRVAQGKLSRGNIQATEQLCTTAVFYKSSAGDDETLIIDASADTEFADLKLWY